MAKERLAQSQAQTGRMAAGLPAREPEDPEDDASHDPDLRKQIGKTRKDFYGPGFKGWLRRLAAGPGLPPGHEISRQ